MLPDEFKTPYKPRRPPPRPNKSGETSQPWTTARCKRLLRPLVSRIASLRKDTATSLLNAQDDELEQERRGQVEQQSTNHEWLGPRKKVRLTYSQKRPSRRQDGQSTLRKDARGVKPAECHQDEMKATIPGEIVAATPLLRRARGLIVPSPSVARNQCLEPEQPVVRCRQGPPRKKVSAKQKDVDQRLAKLRAQSASDRYNDLEAICRSLEALLKATRHDSQHTRGPRSFLDMCLRKVPRYIEDLEAWEKMEAEENGTISTLDSLDASTHIYNYLESIGPNEALGWKHLRVVVRADGIDAVKKGISEGLFGDDFSELLIDLCVQNGALSEAEELIETLTDRQFPQPTSPDSSFSELVSLRPLSVLWTFANKHSRTSFLLRQYSLLLSNGKLPKDWLATGEFERIWALAARHLSIVEAADDAITFMGRSIPLLCRRRRTFTGGPDAARLERDLSMATRQTLISALTMLTAMSSLGEIERHSAHVSEAEITKIYLIGNRLRYILRSCMADLRTRCGFGADISQIALFLSSKCAGDDVISSHVKNSIEQAWRQNTESSSTKNGRVKHRLNDMAWFVSSVARSCGRGMSLASHNCLDMLFGQFESLNLDPKILDSIKAVAAFSLAQQTNNVKDFIYAEKLASNQQESVSTGDDDECSRSLFTGYRWEESIGEWVMVSPVVERRRRQSQATITTPLGSSSRFEVDHSDLGAEQVTSQSGGGGYGEADNVPDLEIEWEHDVGRGRKGQGPLALAPGRVNTKKRARSCAADEKPRMEIVVTALHRSMSVVPQLKKSAYLSLDDELSSDKENWNHAVTKKPRKSVDRMTMLGSKPRSGLASQASISMLGDNCSDDELCM